MMKQEYEAWCNATGNYSSTEKIDWLLNTISVLEKKVQYHIDNGNNLYSIIKQQQAKANEVSSRPASVHPEIVRLHSEINELKKLADEYRRRLQHIYESCTGRFQ